jgi:hypothetical protein
MNSPPTPSGCSGIQPLDVLRSEQLTADVNRLLDQGGRTTKQRPDGRPLAPKTVRHIAFLVQACGTSFPRRR